MGAVGGEAKVTDLRAAVSGTRSDLQVFFYLFICFFWLTCLLQPGGVRSVILQRRLQGSSPLLDVCKFISKPEDAADTKG